MPESGHNPNPSSTLGFPLPPAADKPPPELYSAMCQEQTIPWVSRRTAK
jgi:hypothetical protein